jgi:hypothetical protein
MPYHPCRCCTTLIAAVLCCAAPAAAQTTSFSDGDFPDAGWIDTMVVGGATDFFGVVTVPSGGNPGAYRQTVHVIGNGTVLRVAHLNLAAIYAPSAEGSITGIDFTFDADHFFSPGAVRYTLLLFQAGNYYSSVPFDDVFPGGWLTFQHQGLAATDFTKVAGSGANLPDFSPSGAPITLGFMTANSDPHSPPGSYTTVSGIDNWAVQVHFVPPVPGFHTVSPCRLIDTRNLAGPLGGPALQPGVPRLFVVTGVCGVPSSAQALSVNLTVVQPAAAGELLLLPSDQSVLPLLGVLSFGAGQTRANNAVLRLAADGSDGLVAEGVSTGSADLVLDVNGYFQ